MPRWMRAGKLTVCFSGAGGWEGLFILLDTCGAMDGVRDAGGFRYFVARSYYNVHGAWVQTASHA